MTPEEFFALPVAIQLKKLFDAYPQMAAKVMAGEPMRAPFAPKFDTRIRVKGGYIWASETSLESLRFWHGRAKSGGDPKYKEKNEKDAKALSFFIIWREWFPVERWTGERNRQQVTADPPSGKSTVREWEAKSDAPRATTATSFDDDDYSGGDDADGKYF